VIHFQLVSTRGTKFDDDAYEILVPAQGGTIALFEDQTSVDNLRFVVRVKARSGHNNFFAVGS
jgi:F0F1-type ATP synthase epsilon subunit